MDHYHVGRNLPVLSAAAVQQYGLHSSGAGTNDIPRVIISDVDRLRRLSAAGLQRLLEDRGMRLFNAGKSETTQKPRYWPKPSFRRIRGIDGQVLATTPSFNPRC
jgi:hypothetical protein